MSEGEGEEGFSCIFDIYFFGIFIFRPKQGESQEKIHSNPRRTPKKAPRVDEYWLHDP